MSARPIEQDPNVFVIWDEDDIDSSFYENTDEPKTLYCALLCVDTEGRPDVIRGYDPSDGIFERPGLVVASLGGIDVYEGEYAREIEDQLYAEFQERRENAIVRGES